MLRLSSMGFWIAEQAFILGFRVSGTFNFFSGSVSLPHIISYEGSWFLGGRHPLKGLGFDRTRTPFRLSVSTSQFKVFKPPIMLLGFGVSAKASVLEL